MMYMAVLKFPRIRLFKLRTAVHITDASGPAANNTDKFWKVRPLVDVVREQCLQLNVME